MSTEIFTATRSPSRLDATTAFIHGLSFFDKTNEFETISKEGEYRCSRELDSLMRKPLLWSVLPTIANIKVKNDPHKTEKQYDENGNQKMTRLRMKF